MMLRNFQLLELHEKSHDARAALMTQNVIYQNGMVKIVTLFTLPCSSTALRALQGVMGLLL